MAVLLNDSTYRDQDAMEGAAVAVVFLLYKQAFLLPLIPSSSPTLRHEPVAQVWLIIISGFSQLSDDSGEDMTSSWACGVLSRSVVSDSLRPHGLQPTKLLYPWGFSRQEYWSGLPCPPPGDLPNPGIKPRSPTLPVDSLPSEPPGKPKNTGVGILLLQENFPTS